MHSVGIAAAVVLFALVATTSALNCRPVTCMIACPLGFDVDANGCPICNCRRSPSVCVELIFGYNCGSFEHRDCPSSHECHLSMGGMTGQCCLKPRLSTSTAAGSTTRQSGTDSGTRSTPVTTRITTGTPVTTRTTTGTPVTPRTTTSRALSRLLAATTAPGTAPSTTGAAQTTSGGTTPSWLRFLLPH